MIKRLLLLFCIIPFLANANPPGYSNDGVTETLDMKGTTLSDSTGDVTVDDMTVTGTATMATGSVTTLGATTMSGNLAMGSNDITGLGDLTATGDAQVRTLTTTGDGGGSRVELKCNTVAPTYTSGEAGIDCTTLPTDAVDSLWWQDGDGNRSRIGHQPHSARFFIRDAAINATAAECASPTVLVNNSVVTCGDYNSGVPIPADENWVFHSISIFVTEALTSAVEECGVFFSYSSTKANFEDACITPDCAASTQQPIAVFGVDPGGDGSSYYLEAAMGEYIHDLGDVKVTAGGFWRVLIDEVHTCVGGDDVGKPCWDVTSHSDCAGGGTCTQSATSCTASQSANLTLNYSVYK